MQIRNTTKNTIIATQGALADTPWTRMVGLLRRSSIGRQEALLITHCKSIHMVFMRFAIDVLFVDENNSVVGVVEGIKPFRFSPVYWRSAYVIELHTGAIKQSGTTLGDRIAIEY